MSKLIQDLQDMEQKYQEDMMAKKEEFAKALEDIRDADAEDYNNLKVRLETDMQTLEQHHATMQANELFPVIPLYFLQGLLCSLTVHLSEVLILVGVLQHAGSLSIQCREVGI